jgi:hypothetical protein
MTKPLTPQQVDALLAPRPTIMGFPVILDERVARGTVEFRDDDGKLLGKIVDISTDDTRKMID